MSNLFPKISGPFGRHAEGPLRNKLNGQWTCDEFRVLAGLDWHWTEKVDGTNIRVIWDGHRVTFAGRTDKSTMPAELFMALEAMFPEELLEQTFGVTAAVLYGEGYGAKIQKGGNYRPDQSFTLFDVKIGDWWLKPEGVTGVAGSMGVDRAPELGCFPIATAIRKVATGFKSRWGDFWAEGMVGRPPLGILGRDGDRLLVKVKHVDFYGQAAQA